MSSLDGVFQKNLGIKRNSTFRYVLQVRDKVTKEPRNLSGYSARMEIRSARSPTALLYQALTNPPASGTGIDMSLASTGTITLLMDNSVTNAFTWRTAQYDLAVIDGSGEPEHIMQGAILMTTNVLA